MTTHHIKNKLKVEFNKFLKSITDDKIKALIKENAIITGGAIASMFYDELVNDYDVYFKSKSATVEIAQYFINQFKKEIQKFIKDNNIKDTDIIKHQLNIYCTEAIGGVKVVIPSVGIVTLDTFEKYKYFERSTTAENDISEILDPTAEGVIISAKAKKEKNVYIPLCISQNAITLSDKFQLILRFVGEPAEIHKNFDFVHSTNYWIASTNELILNKDALESLLTKKLKYVGSLYPLATLFRVRKFLKRGFNIHAGELIKIGFQINDLDLNDMEVLMDQLTGVDMAYLMELIEEVKKEHENDKNFKVTSLYICELVDKIFD